MDAAPQASEAVPAIGSDLINDACWKFVATMPHQLPGPVFNDLKPALYAAVCHVLADRQLRAGDARPDVDLAELAGSQGAEFTRDGFVKFAYGSWINFCIRARAALTAQPGAQKKGGSDA